MRTLVSPLVLAACATGAPPGFSRGNQWTFPLVDPLGGVLVTPVKIHGAGPYLFVIDPDVNAMIIDEKVAVDAKLRVDRGYGPHYIDKTDTGHRRFAAEVLDLEVGNLRIERRTAMLVPNGTYASGIHGVLGRSVIEDSLVFGFDRDRGLAFLTTQEGFSAPPNASTIGYRLFTRPVNDTMLSFQETSSGGHNEYYTAYAGDQHFNDPSDAIEMTNFRPVSRRLVTATIGDRQFALHVNFESLPSALRESLWAKASLAGTSQQVVLMDESATRLMKAKLAISPRVAVGAVAAEGVAFVPHEDKRWADELFDGELGLGFFDRFAVWANWDKRTLYLTPRGDVAASSRARIARWPRLAQCPHLGCVAINVIDPVAGEPPPADRPHPGVIVSIARDKELVGVPLEVVVAASGANGETLGELHVVMPEHADRVLEHLHPEYAGARVEVIDASPFPRGCGNDGGCVDVIARR
jgi:hypothetical protein